MVRITFLIILSIAFFGILLSTHTNAFFTDSVTSTTNVFAASAEFPTASVSASPTATPTNTPSLTLTITPSVSPTPQPGDVVINEIMWMGSTSNSTADEWIELKNMTASAIDISNWVLEKAGDTSTPNIIIPAGRSIPANGFFLISNNAASGSMINIVSDLVTTAVSLDNDGEQLVLKNNSSVIIDIANGTVSWLAGINTTPLKRSMARKNPPADGILGGSWGNSTIQLNLDAGSVDFASPKADNGF